MITGGIKFFDKSKNYYDEGATASANSSSASAIKAIDRNPLSYYRSETGSDVFEVEIIVEFASAAISRLLLVDHNFKLFDVYYWNGSVWTEFTNVVGIDGALAGTIAETTFAQNTAYYEFSSVTTTKIRIHCTQTQTVNAKKYVSQIICTNEVGTFTGYPEVAKVKPSRNERKKSVLSGKYFVEKSEASFSFDLKFKNYPTANGADLDVMWDIFDREDPFLVWLCGGRMTSTYFGYKIRGFRPQDIYLMQAVGDFDTSYAGNVYVNSINLTAQFEEVVL